LKGKAPEWETRELRLKKKLKLICL